MLAGIRQVAYGLAIVVAGFLLVALAQVIWATLAFDLWSDVISLGDQRSDVMGRARAHAFAVFAGYEPLSFLTHWPTWWSWSDVYATRTLSAWV